METKEFIVSAAIAEETSVRIDSYLVKCLPNLSRSHLQKLIADKHVTVNQKQVKANHRLSSGDQITVVFSEAKPAAILPQDIPLDILYEDKDMVIINKPRGMVVHPAAGNYEGTLVNALLRHCSDLSGINGVIRPGIVHRLDKDTTGVLVVAKNDEAHLNLAAQIKERSASRKYLALVHGNLAEEQGVIHAPIGRHPFDRKKMAVTPGKGKDALTNFRVIERFGQYTLLECKLQTGRTHQIRVHMTYIGHSVVGDPKYGSGKKHFALTGQALHSFELSLTHPVTGEKMLFTAPPPTDFLQVLQQLRHNKP